MRLTDGRAEAGAGSHRRVRYLPTYLGAEGLAELAELLGKAWHWPGKAWH